MKYSAFLPRTGHIIATVFTVDQEAARRELTKELNKRDRLLYLIWLRDNAGVVCEDDGSTSFLIGDIQPVAKVTK